VKKTYLFVLTLLMLHPLDAFAIVSGDKVASGKYPAVVKIGYAPGYLTPLFDPFCTGTLISKKIILTAAHCLSADLEAPLEVVFNDRFKTVRKVKAIAIHEDYLLNPSLSVADIALLHLESEVLHIPYYKVSSAKSNPGQKYKVLGYGYTKTNGNDNGTLRSALQIDYTYQSQEFLGNSVTPYILTAIYISKNNKISSTCSGDSGGPLLYNNKVIGLTSFGDPDCNSSSPTVYTRISAFNRWIATAKTVLDDHVALYLYKVNQTVEVPSEIELPIIDSAPLPLLLNY